MEVKEKVRALLDRLPDDCTMDDILYHLYVLQEISHGLADVDRGKTIPHDVVRERLRQKWLIGNAE
jgi:predicted transcriptional regulator